MATSNIIAKANYKSLVGVVTNAGERLKTIRIRVPREIWNDRVQKHFASPYHLLVNDPNRSCNVGDVIRVRSNWRVSKHVRHVVTDIISPFGAPLDQRPPLATEAERTQIRSVRRKAKDERQAARGRIVAVKRLRDQGKLQEQDEADERAAEERLQAGGEVLEPKVRAILLAENDLDKIRIRVIDTIKIQLSEDLHWALKDDIVDCLTLWVAYRHAQEKQLYIGKTIAIMAGKNPQSPSIREDEAIAALMKKQERVYGGKLLEHLAPEQQDYNAIRGPLGRLQRRLTSGWKKHVFETRDAKPEAARMERRLVQVIKSTTSPSETVMDWAAVINKFENLLSSSDNANSEIESTSEYTVVQNLEASGVEQSVDSESNVTDKMRDLDISNEVAQPSEDSQSSKSVDLIESNKKPGA